MSRFGAIIEDFNQWRDAKAQAALEAGAEASRARGQFMLDFARVIDTTAMPILDEFVADAQAEGYPAELTRVDMTSDDPSTTIRFVGLKGSRLGRRQWMESIFSIRARPRQSKIEIVSQHDGSDAPGTRRVEIGISEVTTELLTQELEDFLRSALSARAEDDARRE